MKETRKAKKIKKTKTTNTTKTTTNAAHINVLTKIQITGMREIGNIYNLKKMKLH